jgi:hypothetical protein
MSKKTIKQRIAVVAVSALTAGLLTVMSTPAVNAAATATLNVAANGPVGPVVDDATTNAKSAGILGTPTATSGTTMTATMLSTGTLSVWTAAATGDTYLTVTGGTISSSLTNDYLSADLTIAGLSSTGAMGALIKPNAGVSTMTVKLYDEATVAAGASGGVTAAGTLSAQLVVTIATTSASGAYSAADSYVNTAVASSATADGIDQNNATTASPYVIPNGTYAYINFDLYDSYGVGLADATSAIAISATGGGLVNASATLGTATTPANTLAVLNSAHGTITVGQAVADKPANVSVTIARNGVNIGTKNFTFLGEVAKVEASRSQTATAATTTADAFRVKYFDAAGTQLYPSDDTTATTVVSTTTNQFITTVTVPTTGVRATATAAKGSVYCAGTAASGAGVGSADLQLQYVNASGTIVKSNVWKQTCGGNAYSYTASLDKASYTPGSIATLTITFKDASGNLTHIGASNISSSGNEISIVGGPAATAITAPAAGDIAGSASLGNAAGTKTYQFVVGSDLGDFTAVVAVPLLAANQAKVTVPYSIKASTTGVTNEEVLKSIVALIASINKQIQALQKLILRR